MSRLHALERDQNIPASLVLEDGILYQTGFGNSFETEAIPNALPRGRNNPRQVPYQLYTEQLSGTAFTVPRHINRRTWLYRIQPAVAGACQAFVPCSSSPHQTTANTANSHNTSTSSKTESELPQVFNIPSTTPVQADPNPMRWNPMPFCPKGTTTFLSGLKLLMSSGSPLTKFGLAIYMYSFDQDMIHEHWYNSDGDILIVPQTGSLRIHTELGRLVVHPHELCVIPRGIVFSVHKFDPTDPPTRGYVLETYAASHFQLPELGPLGSNGLANARDFYHPTAWCSATTLQEYTNEHHVEDGPHIVYTKFGGTWFVRRNSPHTPYNVVAWHGTYAPFKYNLNRFCAINSVTYDHVDPSIYTVLTCVGGSNSGCGEALADVVIFPPRTLATDTNTLRPPWFHRNTMSEFMGLLSGQYDAKQSQQPGGGGGFQPGGASLHPCMTPHGPDTASYEKAIADECTRPVRWDGGMAFMFETTCLLEVSDYARSCNHRDYEYATSSWSGLKSTFDGWHLLSQLGATDDDKDEITPNEN